MEAVDLRKGLITTINTLPADMLEELNKFLSFLEYTNLSNTDGSKEEILQNIETSAKEMQKIKEGTLKARSANEFLNEL
ncbi:MAG: Unknown protein [uncultured Sulfurovum sp.]|uniref:DUF2281 domain-containing protein n=1 Tax=uncultured Sulfurovum sp. TaxID=269237 RepID=A0A6S6SWU1_9BACT|nr:MAG: Unknown protein [uncultured Sulfurovum sp.]